MCNSQYGAVLELLPYGFLEKSYRKIRASPRNKYSRKPCLWTVNIVSIVNKAHLDEVISLQVHGSGRFVQDQDLGLAEQSAGQADQLALPDAATREQSISKKTTVF